MTVFKDVMFHYNVIVSGLLYYKSLLWEHEEIIFFIIIPSGVRLSPLGAAATTGLLYQPQMLYDGDCGAIGVMTIGRGNRSTRRKPVPVPLCPPQIPHDLTWAQTWAAVVGSQRLTASAMARPTKYLSQQPIEEFLKWVAEWLDGKLSEWPNWRSWWGGERLVIVRISCILISSSPILPI
jgi:hypothetical protein